MAIYGDWIKTCTRIGASLGGVTGFFYASYTMVTSHVFSWTDVSDTIESIVVFLVTAVMISSLCIAIGWLAGLVVAVITSPLRSFTASSGPRK